MTQHSVVFVCLGNICRSPMAELIFRKMINNKGIEEHWTVDSAGTAAYHIGESPDPRSVAECKRHLGDNIEVSHRARQVKTTDFLNFDYILCMDESNYEDLREFKPPKAKAKLHLLGSFDPEGKLEVGDPYYSEELAFNDNFNHITRSCEAFLKHLGYN